MMNYIGHFKLDILYSFFMVISVGIGYGGFVIVKKLLKLIQYEKSGVSNKLFKNTDNKANKLQSISKNLPSFSKNLPSVSKNLPSVSKNLQSISKNLPVYQKKHLKLLNIILKFYNI